ncbi:MAG: OmpA family protein [Gammaproteobacteria bacterium]|nr:OmpA family protein [Gammaproteobacteria bacterium]
MKKNILLCCLMAGFVALQGCSTINPYTQEKQTSKSTKGAMVGAAAGIAAGLLSGDGSKDRKKKALKGAGIGAIAGASVGYYMDVQETKLRQKLQSTGVSVTRDGENIILNMPANITFASDSATLKPSFIEVLDSVTEVLKEYKSTMIQVAGHTDSTGSDSYNQRLSLQRAQAVSFELMRFKVESQRIETIGLGEAYPIASNSTPQGREQNRRVELTLLPYTQ